MKKVRILIAALLSMFALAAVPAVSSAHYVMHSYDAQFYGQAIAGDDCAGRNQPYWHCYEYPLYNSVWAVSDHTWRVQVGWKQASDWGAVIQCYTETDWTHGVLTYHRVSAGC